MAHYYCEQQRLDRPVNGFWQRLALLLQWLGRRLERWDQLAHSRRQLREMDERMLKDIGLSSADVERIAGRRFWDDPQQHREVLDERYRSSDKG